jgi:hypothetical protein
MIRNLTGPEFVGRIVREIPMPRRIPFPPLGALPVVIISDPSIRQITIDSTRAEVPVRVADVDPAVCYITRLGRAERLFCTREVLEEIERTSELKNYAGILQPRASHF